MHSDTTRTASIEIVTPDGFPYRVTVQRETFRTYDEDGRSYRISTRTVRRTLSEIEGQALPDGPITLSNYGELAALIARCAASLDAEDLAAGGDGA